MMNKKYMYLLAGGLLIAACTDTTENMDLPTGNEVRFGGGVGWVSPAMSKAEENATEHFADGATIGVYAYKTDASDYEANGKNGKYVCTDGVFACQPAEGALPLFWPTRGALNFIAYSPYDESAVSATFPNVTYTTPDIVDQSGGMATDVLYAFKAEVSAGRAPVELTFKHALAKLNVVLEGAFGMEFVAKPIVKIGGLKTKAEISLSESATITPSGAVAKMIPFQTEEATARNVSVSVLVVPQEVELTEMALEFIYIRNAPNDTEGDKYKFNIKKKSTSLPFIKDGKLTFEAGKEYTLKLTLKNKEAEIKNAKVSIIPWTTGDNASGGGDAEWPEL